MAEEGNLIPVYREILADLETPVSAYLKIGGEYSYLLESVEGGEKWARYTFLGGDPEVVVSSKGRTLTVVRNGVEETRTIETDPLEAIEEMLSAYRPVPTEGLPRFFGGAVGYIGYDVVRFFEELPDETDDDLDLPDMVFLITDTILIFDNILQKIKVVSNAHVEGHSLKEAYQEACDKVHLLIEKLRGPAEPPKPPPPRVGPLVTTSNFSKADFMRAVERTREYITAGDCVQTVLSQRLEADIRAHPFNIYRALRTINPSPYMYYLELGGTTIVGSSPEVLVRQEGDRLILRPIAGTRPRGATEEEDEALERELLADPKERAEHIMLVDLGRNDLGRVSLPGSVEVDELMVIEKYSHVIHIVSNVVGTVRPELTSYDVLRASFPAGTVSGAPKIRAMEIIEELEPTKRGPYAGAIGYFSFSGNMETCITIRTLVIQNNRAYLQVGAGIVADSDPEREFEETMDKARALLRAVELAEEGLHA
ncbi:anthranilate synthase component I [Nitrospinae bacterium AH-259-F20]|nr:anthranilate synthase component I [Nitrospinae bacterium AH-259-F20]